MHFIILPLCCYPHQCNVLIVFQMILELMKYFAQFWNIWPPCAGVFPDTYQITDLSCPPLRFPPYILIITFHWPTKTRLPPLRFPPSSALGVFLAFPQPGACRGESGLHRWWQQQQQQWWQQQRWWRQRQIPWWCWVYCMTTIIWPTRASNKDKDCFNFASIGIIMVTILMTR